MPEIFSKLPVGDYPLAIYMALNGKIHYIAKVMSAYRVMAKGSWSERNLNNKEYAYKISCEMIIGLKKLNNYTKYKYNKEFKKVILWHSFDNLMYEKDYVKIFTKSGYIILFIKKIMPSNLKIILKKIITKIKK